MEKKDLKKYKLPDAPGVYLFRDARRKLLYVGKATSLKSRVRSYFTHDLDSTRGPLIVNMVSDARALDWIQTDSVLEALILEANLIKEKDPTYNSKEKDNKSFNYLVITKEDFPKVLIVRGRDLFSKWEKKKLKHIFGPFPQGGVLKEALKIIRKIFPFRDKCDTAVDKPCFNAQIGLCPGVCMGSVTKKEYAKTVRHIQLLFEGKKLMLLKSLETEMQQHATLQDFERAACMRNKLHALTHLKETALIGSEYKTSKGGALGRIEGYDVAHTSEQQRVGVMVVVQDGVAHKGQYKKFSIKNARAGDVAALKEVLERRLEHPEWGMPRAIVVDGSKQQVRAAESVLVSLGLQIPVIGVTKDSRHRAAKIIGGALLVQENQDDILLANTEAHRFALAYHKGRRRKALTDA